MVANMGVIAPWMNHALVRFAQVEFSMKAAQSGSGVLATKIIHQALLKTDRRCYTSWQFLKGLSCTGAATIALVTWGVEIFAILPPRGQALSAVSGRPPHGKRIAPACMPERFSSDQDRFVSGSLCFPLLYLWSLIRPAYLCRRQVAARLWIGSCYPRRVHRGHRPAGALVRLPRHQRHVHRDRHPAAAL